MEMEPSQPVLAKKLWSVVRVMFFMLRKGISKSKFLVDLQLMLKRGKIAGKAFGELMLRPDYSALTCRSDDVLRSFISPKEYEFSCSNSPVYPSFYTKRHHNHHHRRRHYHHHRNADDASAIQRVIEMLKDYENRAAAAAGTVEASPLIVLPGFGRSPAVRQLRITDSPFPLKEMEGDDVAQVDKAAEEFISKFYKELKKQRRMTALESPSPFHVWGR